MHRRSLIVTLASMALSTLFGFAPALAAEPYPNRAVTIVVPYTPGGGTDSIARLYAQKLSERWNQSVVVENRPGADSVIGSAQVARSPADGYQLLMILPAHPINASLKAQLPFDPQKDLVPIAMLAASSWTIVVNPQVPAKNLKELIAMARAQPGKLSVAVSDPQSRLGAELFMKVAGIQWTIVPYKGGSQAAADILAGHVPVGVGSVPSIAQHYKSGAIRALAVTGQKRSASLPDIPTVAEAGVDGFEMEIWYALAARAGTPQETLDTIATAINEIAKMPDVQARLTELSAEPRAYTQAQFARFVDGEFDKYRSIVKTAGIKPE